MNASHLPARQIASDVFVAPQLLPAQMAAAAQAGFRSVVNNRPDHEDGPGSGQPTNASLEAAALAAGLQYRHLPVASAFQSAQDAQAFRQLLDELPRPLLVFCRSGARSTRLFALAQQG